MKSIKEISVGIVIGMILSLSVGHNNQEKHPSSNDIYVYEQDSIKIMKVNEWNILYRRVGNDSVYNDCPKSMFYEQYRSYKRIK